MFSIFHASSFGASPGPRSSDVISLANDNAAFLSAICMSDFAAQAPQMGG